MMLENGSLWISNWISNSGLNARFGRAAKTRRISSSASQGVELADVFGATCDEIHWNPGPFLIPWHIMTFMILLHHLYKHPKYPQVSIRFSQLVPWSHGPMVPWSHGPMVPWHPHLLRELRQLSAELRGQRFLDLVELVALLLGRGHGQNVLRHGILILLEPAE